MENLDKSQGCAGFFVSLRNGQRHAGLFPSAGDDSRLESWQASNHHNRPRPGHNYGKGTVWRA